MDDRIMELYERFEEDPRKLRPDEMRALASWLLAEYQEFRHMTYNAVRNAKRFGSHDFQWGAVADVFAIGSTSARRLCEKCGVKPDEEIRTCLPPAPENPDPPVIHPPTQLTT